MSSIEPVEILRQLQVIVIPIIVFIPENKMLGKAFPRL